MGDGLMATFRIYPRSGRKLYLTVRIFKTKRGMREYCIEHCSYPMKCGIKAVVHSYKKIGLRPLKNDVVYPEIGDIHLYVGGASPSIIVHELTHAALLWIRRIERKDSVTLSSGDDYGYVTGSEELICHAVGNMFCQVNVKLHKIGIW
jgi:hypothetical protein